MKFDARSYESILKGDTMENDPISFPEPSTTEEQCDYTLGVYMRCWGELEITQQLLFAKLLETDITSASIVFSALDQRKLRDVSLQLGKTRLQQKHYNDLEKLIKRCANAATKRNRIVHGFWQLKLVMGPSPNPKPLMAQSAHWERIYNPLDRDELYALRSGKDKSVVEKYCFTPERLIDFAKDVRLLANEVGKFAKEIVLLPVSIPRPIDL
ncbi:hypothetical protein [Ferrovibrio sp.]|uniref:hypothetical protein n=1 Tax=Ferrovibrio sp. TaxID=1917215 RepID=UPI003D2A830E